MAHKVCYRISDNVNIESVGDGVKDVMQGLSDLAQVFAHAGACGVCSGKDIAPNVRTPQGFTYYELQCCNPNCGARLSFGQHQNGDTLFPKVRDNDGNALPDGGWAIYRGDVNQQPKHQKARSQGQQQRQAPQPADDSGGFDGDFGGSELPF